MSDPTGERPASNGYHKGPLLLRRGQVPVTTTDQRLLARGGGDADWRRRVDFDCRAPQS